MQRTKCCFTSANVTVPFLKCVAGQWSNEVTVNIHSDVTMGRWCCLGNHIQQQWVGNVPATHGGTSVQLYHKALRMWANNHFILHSIVWMFQIAYKTASLVSDVIVETHRRKHLAYLMADQGALINPEASRNLPKQVANAMLIMMLGLSQHVNRW